MCVVKMKALMTILEALKTINSFGYKTFSANTLAEIMWPEARDINTNGQRFNLCAGIAGKMLRKCNAVREVQNRVWEIKRHRIKHITK